MGKAQSHVVMVVEDDTDTREALCEALFAFGFEARSAENGKRALEILKESPQPCVILLDMMMPVMDGWEFRAVQRTKAELAEIPVVCLTADVAARIRAIGEGCVAFLAKPVEMDELIEKIREYC